MIFIFSLNFSIFLTFLWKCLNRFKVFKYSQYHPLSKRYLKNKSCCFLWYQVQASFPWSLNSFLSLLSSQMLDNLPQSLAAGNSAHFQLTVSIGHESGHSLSGLSASRSLSQAAGPGSTGSNREGLTSRAHSMVAEAFSFSQAVRLKTSVPRSLWARSFSHLLATCASPPQQLFTKA